jgi:polyphosphate kinase
LFNLLTGICQYQGSQKFLVAPFDLHERMLQLIAREAAHARQGLPARIIAKINSLVDERIIAALYEASQAGVNIDLIVRGICCLRPGLPGVSENITVRSIVDRFLEHHRIYYFENAARPEVFLSSADWMPRNFFRRIEVAFPVEDGVLRSRIMDEILAVALADNVKARHLQADGAYVIPPKPRNTPTRRSQFDFIALAQGGSRINGKIPAGRHPRVQVRRSPPTPRPR